MKTKVRVIKTADYAINQHAQYEHFNIEVLAAPNKLYPESLTTVCTISFQGTIAERGTRENYWYAPHIELRHDLGSRTVGSIASVLKLAKYIEANSEYDIQPEQLLLLIGADKYIYDGDYIPESYKGLCRYQVMDGNGRYYSRIYAANNIVAEKIRAKKYPACTLKPIGIVESFTK